MDHFQVLYKTQNKDSLSLQMLHKPFKLFINERGVFITPSKDGIKIKAKV